jgi:hypothetical protein
MHSATHTARYFSKNPSLISDCSTIFVHVYGLFR